MSELKPCPFCNIPPASKTSKIDGKEYYSCLVADCPNGSWLTADEWNTRPIEDALTARIAELEAENNRLAELLHNELSSVEIATDLGNKRWVALNDIYENGEKHNTNWCKRKAQEGLGIK